MKRLRDGGAIGMENDDGAPAAVWQQAHDRRELTSRQTFFHQKFLKILD